jgi:hypothetical protein
MRMVHWIVRIYNFWTEEFLCLSSVTSMLHVIHVRAGTSKFKCGKPTDFSFRLDIVR